MLNHGDIHAKNLGLRPKMKRNGGRRNVYFDGEGKRRWKKGERGERWKPNGSAASTTEAARGQQ